MTILGPSLRYYGEIIRDFTDVDLPVSSSIPLSSPGLYDALFALGGNARPTGLSALASLGLETASVFNVALLNACENASESRFVQQYSHNSSSPNWDTAQLKFAEVPLDSAIQ